MKKFEKVFIFICELLLLIMITVSVGTTIHVNQVSSIMLSASLEDQLNAEEDAVDFKAFVSNCKINNKAIPEDMEDLKGNCSVSFIVFVKGGEGNHNITNYKDAINLWAQENSINCTADFYEVDEEAYSSLDASNFKGITKGEEPLIAGYEAVYETVAEEEVLNGEL